MHNIPNILSLMRLASAAVLLWLAWTDQQNIFLIVLVAAIFSDWLDGFIARRFDYISELGAKLDSWADAAIYFTLAISAYLLWPTMFLAEKVFFALMITSIVVPVSIGLIKFRIITSYHTWLVKVAATAAVISTLILFLDISALPFRWATALALLAGLEQTAITFILKKPASDVRTIWHVWNRK